MACPSFTAMVLWCGGGLFSAPEAVQREKVGKIGKKTIFNIGTGGSTTGKGSQNWQKAIFNRISGRDVRHFFGAISWRVRPSLPWCFGVASVAEYWQKTIFNRVSEGTLDSFLVRFRGVSVLHCHGVLVWRRAVFSTGKRLAKLAKGLFLIGFQKGR